jgi:sodium/hydrogen exchanger 8
MGGMKIYIDTEVKEEAHEFGAFNTLLLVVILSVCIMVAYLIKSSKFYYLPESGACLIIGVLVGGTARLLFGDDDELEFLSFDPEVFFFLLLPPIILEAGFGLDRERFFTNIGSISAFAVLGTLVSTFVIGYSTAWFISQQVVPFDGVGNEKEVLRQCLMFGALISAVDPVATLSIMGNAEIKCDPLLYSLVFGESVLNDAVAIVLFRTFKEFKGEFTNESVHKMVMDFVNISVGSVIVGVVVSLICAYICKETNLHTCPDYEMAMLLLFSYGAYAFAEVVELSGIMCLFFYAIVQAHYNEHNLSYTTSVGCEQIFKSFALIAEFLVFVYMGMGFLTGKFKVLLKFDIQFTDPPSH